MTAVEETKKAATPSGAAANSGNAEVLALGAESNQLPKDFQPSDRL